MADSARVRHYRGWNLSPATGHPSNVDTVTRGDRMVVPAPLSFTAARPAEAEAVTEPASAPATDAALLRAIALGDVDAHRRLYERHAAAVFAFLVARTGDRQQAEDVLQEVMIAVWKGASGFRGASAVRTWLIGIAAHKASHALRAARRESADPPPGGSGAAPGAWRGAGIDDRLDVAAAVAALPEAQRTVVVLFFFDGQSLEAISALLDVPMGTVKSRLHRAKAQLKAVLGTTAADPSTRGPDAPPADSTSAERAPHRERSKEVGDVR